MKKWTFYFFIGLLVMLGVTDISRQVLHGWEARRKIKKLTLQRAPKRENVTAQKIYFVPKERVVTSFFSAIQKTGLQLKSVAILQNKEIMIDALLAGDFIQIEQLLKELARQCFPFEVKKVSIEKQQKQVNLRLNVSFLRLCAFPARNFNFSKPLADPFSTEILTSKQTFLQDESIKQIRLAGFLQYAKKQVAIVTSSNGSSREIFIGDYLGYEHAKLVDIQSQKIIFQLNGKKISIGS